MSYCFDTFNINLLTTSSITYKSFLLSVLDYLNTLPDSETNKIYIGGTVDYNPTLFEAESLSGRLGVISSSQRVGFTLLTFLRMIIDDNHKLILSFMEEFEDDHGKHKEVFTIDEVVELFSEDYEDCNGVHSMTEKSTILLEGGVTVIVNPKKMDLWTFQRIRDYIEQEFI